MLRLEEPARKCENAAGELHCSHFRALILCFVRGLVGLSGLHRLLERLAGGYWDDQEWVGVWVGWIERLLWLEGLARKCKNAAGGGGFVGVLLKKYIYYPVTY